MSIWEELRTAGETAAGPEPGQIASECPVADITDAEIDSPRDLSAAELKLLVDAGSDWIWETDSEFRFSWLSENYEEITGIAPENVLGRFRFDFLKQVSKGSVSIAGHLADLEARRPFRDFVYQLKESKPNCRWVSIAGYPRFAEDGTFIGYRGVARNVTSIAASLEEFVETHHPIVKHDGEVGHANEMASLLAADLERTLDSLRMGVVLLDSSLRAQIINKAFYDIWKLAPEDVAVGSHFRALMDINRHNGVYDVPDDQWESYVASRLAEIAGGDVAPREFLRRDSRAMIYSVTALSGGKRLVCYYDITDMKNREAERAIANDRSASLFADLRLMVDSMPIGVLVLDRHLRAEIVNRAFCDIWDIAPGRIAEGATLRRIMEASRDIDVHGADDAEWEAHIARREAELGSGQTGTAEVALANGHTIICTTVPLSGGRTLATYVDVTELKRRRVEADEARKHLENVLESLPASILIYDHDDNYVFANRKLQEGMPALKPIWKPGSNFRDAFELGHSVGHFRFSGNPEVDALYDVDRDKWIDGIIAEYHLRHAEFERENPDGSWQKVYNMRADDGAFIGVRVDITEIKEREIALQDSMNQVDLLRHTLDELPVAAFIKADDLRIEYVNKAWCGITGISKQQAVGRTDRELFADEADGYADCDTEVSLTGRNIETEEPVKHRDGTVRQLMTRKSRLIASDGSVHLVGSSTDITDVKEREKALRDSMSQIELLRRTLDELPVMAFIKSEDFRLEYVNKAWTAMTGLSREESVGRTDAELFNLSEADGYNRDDVQVLQTGGEIETEEPLVHRDGTTRQMMTRKSRLVGADGTAHLVGSATDISDLKDRERRLNESLRENEIFRSMIDNVPVAIYAKRPDLKLFYVNRGWSDLTGCAKQNAIGRTDAELFGAEGETFMEGDRMVLQTRSTRELAETFTAPNGSVQYQIARKSVMEATDGSLYLIGSTTDITELKQREKELEEAQRKAVLADRAKSEFLANMSHEIRTPMNGVLGMAELLAKSELNTKQKMFTDIIVKSGNALLTIINDILDFSKIDAGQLVLDSAPFNLAEAIEDVATLVSTRAKEKDLEMIVRVEPKCQQMFHGDVGRFRQIITNLVGNAVKFTDKGHVLVEVTGQEREGKTRLKVSVTDTGIGIPADKLRLVFEKFSQVDSSSTRRHEGTGLGLAITSRLVELMGGEIGVESTEGQGSTFWFTVALENAGEPADRRPPPLDVTGARVLVIDDNQVNRAILSEQMQSWTFDSCAAESGAVGIRVLEAAAEFGVPVDCVILDYQMPAMTGADVARVIRSTPAIADTPIVMLTSVDQTLSNGSYRDLGVEAQLIKPARSSALLDALVTTIQRHRSANGMTPTLEARDIEAMIAPQPQPVAPARHLVEATFDPASPLVGDHRIDILVAEDNEVNQLVFTQILAETPYTFQIVANGRLAVEAFGGMNPRMILMDVSMPEMNGIEATAMIRRSESQLSSRVPIVGVTAHALKGDRERCLEAGMDDYLPKPISPKALLDKVEKWAGHGAERQRSAG